MLYRLNALKHTFKENRHVWMLPCHESHDYMQLVGYRLFMFVFSVLGILSVADEG